MLSGQKIVVFGGTGLIGNKIVTACHHNDAYVIVAGRDIANPKFEELCQANGTEFPFVEVNTSDPKSVEQVLVSTESFPGDLTAVVNCEFPRNSEYGRDFETVAFKDFCDNVTLHIGGSFLVCQKSAEYFSLKDGGNIINMSSIYGFLAPRFQIYAGTDMTKEIEYAICKSAIIQMTRYLARYLKGRNIRVNCISPGGIFDDQPTSFVKNYNEFCLNKGMLDAEDIVGAVLFLLSDQSRYINGQNIVIDDGFSL